MQPFRGRAYSAFRMAQKPVLAAFPFLRQLEPDMISGLSLVFSPIAYLLLSERAILASIVTIFFVLLLDVFDGIVARAKEQTGSRDGWMVDVAVDRVSEAIICLALSRVFILLSIVNMGLALLSCKYKKHAIIPLRQVTLVILVAYFLLQSHTIFSLLDQIVFCW